VNFSKRSASLAIDFAPSNTIKLGS